MLQGMDPSLSNDSRDRRHLGLGLYIVDKIITAHGGSMLVKSQAEEGTTFSLRLPRGHQHPLDGVSAVRAHA